MDKAALLARAEHRRKMANKNIIARDTPPGKHTSLTEEIGTAWLELAAKRWNPAVQKEVPEGVPVGKEGLAKFVDEYLKRSGFRTREWEIGSVGAEHVARWIDHNGSRVVNMDFPNPITGVEKSKGKGGFVMASNRSQRKTAVSIYDGVEHTPERYRNVYDKPDEWCRTCPEHAGIQMRRVSDGLYQCPIAGDTYSYTDGHNVEFKTGVGNQTSFATAAPKPQAAFLTTPNQQAKENHSFEHNKGTKKDTDFKKETPELYAKFKGFTKKADKIEIYDKLFGPVQVQTRHCPDHNGISLYRIADKIYQCPLDRQVYDFEKGFTTQSGEENLGGSVANMTVDTIPNYANSIRGLSKKAVEEGVQKGREKQKLQLKREKQTSGLQEYKPMAEKWVQPDFPLEQAKKEFTDIIKKVFENDPKSLGRALLSIETAPNSQKLLEHFWYLLMKHEGAGVLYPARASLNKKAFANLDNRFAFDLSHLMSTSSPESKKVVSLVVSNVVQKGMPLAEAMYQAYNFIDQQASIKEESAPAPVPHQQIDVQEDNLGEVSEFGRAPTPGFGQR